MTDEQHCVSVTGGIASLLLSDDASYITGQSISVSGGLTMQG